MPRRKTAQPEPLERFYLPDGTDVEVIDEIGVFGEEGSDNTNARKHWYKKVNVCMKAFINALKVHQGRT